MTSVSILQKRYHFKDYSKYNIIGGGYRGRQDLCPPPYPPINFFPKIVRCPPLPPSKVGTPTTGNPGSASNTLQQH